MNFYFKGSLFLPDNHWTSRLLSPTLRSPFQSHRIPKYFPVYPLNISNFISRLSPSLNHLLILNLHLHQPPPIHIIHIIGRPFLTQHTQHMLTRHPTLLQLLTITAPLIGLQLHLIGVPLLIGELDELGRLPSDLEHQALDVVGGELEHYALVEGVAQGLQFGVAEDQLVLLGLVLHLGGFLEELGLEGLQGGEQLGGVCGLWDQALQGGLEDLRGQRAAAETDEMGRDLAVAAHPSNLLKLRHSLQTSLLQEQPIQYNIKLLRILRLNTLPILIQILGHCFLLEINQYGGRINHMGPLKSPLQLHLLKSLHNLILRIRHKRAVYIINNLHKRPENLFVGFDVFVQEDGPAEDNGLGVDGHTREDADSPLEFFGGARGQEVVEEVEADDVAVAFAFQEHLWGDGEQDLWQGLVQLVPYAGDVVFAQKDLVQGCGCTFVHFRIFLDIWLLNILIEIQPIYPRNLHLKFLLIICIHRNLLLNPHRFLRSTTRRFPHLLGMHMTIIKPHNHNLVVLEEEAHSGAAPHTPQIVVVVDFAVVEQAFEMGVALLKGFQPFGDLDYVPEWEGFELLGWVLEAVGVLGELGGQVGDVLLGAWGFGGVDLVDAVGVQGLFLHQGTV